MAALVVTLRGLGAVAARWARAWVELRIAALSRQISEASASASEAASQASRAREGVTNEHGSHLRDDLDEVRASVHAILDRMDAAEMARREDEDARERRDRRAEDQIDGLRDDMRALSASADRTHTRIEDRIRTLEDTLKTPSPQ